jgi:hypothetical protein
MALVQGTGVTKKKSKVKAPTYSAIVAKAAKAPIVTARNAVAKITADRTAAAKAAAAKAAAAKAAAAKAAAAKAAAAKSTTAKSTTAKAAAAKAAAAKAAAAKSTTTSAPSSQINPATWIDPEFKKYFDAIQQDFADRGLLDSTNKAQPLATLADTYAGRLAQAQQTQNQQAVQNALNLYQLLVSQELAKAQLSGNYDMRFPTDPELFKNIMNASYNTILPGYGKTGDAKVVSDMPSTQAARGEKIPRYSVAIKTVGQQAEERLKAAQAASQALQRAYLKIAQQQAKDAATKNDLAIQQSKAELASKYGIGAENVAPSWNDIASDAISLKYTTGTDGEQKYPEDEIVKLVNAQYGIDLEEEAAKGNARAKSILAIIRPPAAAPKTSFFDSVGNWVSENLIEPSYDPTTIQNSLKYSLISPLAAPAYRFYAYTK